MSDWVCSNCGATNPEAVGSCPTCGIPRGSGASPFGRPAAAESPAPQAAAYATASGTGAAAPTFEPVVPGVAGLAGGIVGGLVAAIAACAVWYAVVALSSWQVGLVAVAVGWLIGQGVLFGAEGRGSMLLVAVSAVLTLVALTVSEYLIVLHFVNQELEAFGAPAIGFVQSPDLVLEVVIESLTIDPLTLVFWAIALFSAVTIPLRAIGRDEARRRRVQGSPV